MTNEEFNAWRQRLGLTYAAAAEALGTSERSVYNYARDGEPQFIIPRYIELACCELERRDHETPIPNDEFTVNPQGNTVTHLRSGAEWRVYGDRLTLSRRGQLKTEQVVQATLAAGKADRIWRANLARYLGTQQPSR